MSDRDLDQGEVQAAEAFPIVAFVEKLGASPRKVASLYVRRYVGDRLLCARRVGTGYTEMIAWDLIRCRVSQFEKGRA